jgi:hypothetical protein
VADTTTLIPHEPFDWTDWLLDPDEVDAPLRTFDDLTPEQQKELLAVDEAHRGKAAKR